MSDAPETKTCENPPCDKTFARSTKSGGESKARFAARKYCCNECKSEAVLADSRASAGTKTCRTCGKPYEKRKRESRNEFLKRSNCSLECRYKSDTGGHRRVQRRPNAALLPEVIREPGQPWRPSGWTREPNVYAGVRQAC